MIRHSLRHAVALAIAAMCCAAAGPATAAEPNFPISAQQRGTAQQVAQAGVALSELAPNAPDSHTVQRGDTLWDISKLFLTSPWRWPELWGMNLAQIRNPHLIYPGQVLVLDKSSGRAVLRVAGPDAGAPSNAVKLSPRVRGQLLDNGAIASIPLHLIGPFLNEAVVFNTSELEVAPRIVATQEGRVMVSRGETAYVRGDLSGANDFRLFRRHPIPSGSRLLASAPDWCWRPGFGSSHGQIPRPNQLSRRTRRNSRSHRPRCCTHLRVKWYW